MPERDTGNRPLISVSEAAEYLGVTSETIEALARASFLTPGRLGPGGPEFRLGDLKAFLARNADSGSGNLGGGMFEFDMEDADPQDLLDALDGRAEEMARRAFEIFASVFPEASGWNLSEQARFIDQAKGRFEAILAVTGQGAEVDEALVEDLLAVGANAAWSNSPLPQLLVVLRISRDLVVQTAVELAEERGRHWGLALSLLLTRVLPAMDRLTDALAQGYWAAVVNREEDGRARYENVLAHSASGVWEIDLDGRIQYANPSLAVILGRRPEQLQGSLLADVLALSDPAGDLALLTTEPPADASHLLALTVVRPDGVRRELEVRSFARYAEGRLVGFQGMVQDQTTAKDLEGEKNEFLALVTHDLRTPLSTIAGLAATLETHSSELPHDRIRRMGRAVRRQAERISRQADDLYELSRLEASSLLLSPRPVELAPVLVAALDAVGDERVDAAAVVEVVVPEGVTVQADPRRLEQVVANLVDNALQYGAPPVLIELVDSDGDAGVEFAIVDHGPGVPPALVPTLFSGLRTLGRSNRDRSRGTGLGLALVRGLVEAMGGRVWYEWRPGAGGRFHVTLPEPRRPAR
ncbi:MAG TPA: ATP-binding protein [Acidimicrobiales bacterium]|nr:ATP-binding protein [Acidimicrobiales bacterium]